MTHSPMRFLPHTLWPFRPIHLTLFVTKRCNARCPFCFYRQGQPDAIANDELRLDEIAKVSASMGTLLWLAISGGEPFVREDLADIVDTFYRNNRPSIILLPTNGLMPERIASVTHEILTRCPKSTVVVKLSLDGPKDTHERLRGVTGSYEKFMSSYEALGQFVGRYRNFELGVNTVFCADNQDSMDTVIDFVKTLPKVKTHTISLVRGALSDKSMLNVDMDKYRRAIERLEHGLKDRTCATYSFRGAKLKAAQDILQRDLIHRTMTSRSRQLRCLAGRLNLVLTELGDLYPCEDFTDDKLMGNVRDAGYDIHALARSERGMKVLKNINKCFCTHECYMMTNILFSPRFYPGLLRQYLLLR